MIDLNNKLFNDIAVLLGEKPRKKINKICEELKIYSYKYVYKAVRILEKQQILTRHGNKYELNAEYLSKLKKFIDKTCDNYNIEHNVFMESVSGKMLNIFTKEEKEDIKVKITKYINKKIMEKLDEWYSKYYDPENIEIKSIKKEVDIKNKRILEIGCGTGRITKQIAEKAKEIIAIDHNKEAIKYCVKKYKSLKNIKFLYDDVENIKIKNQYFDIVITGWIGLYYSKNMEIIIKKLYNLLNKKGILIIIEAYHESEYVKILNIIKPRENKIKEKQEKLRTILYNIFLDLNEKIITTKYIFPSYEKLEETFKIELEYEENIMWKEEYSNKLKAYIQEKKDYNIGESFMIISCKKSTKK